ncbi:MAG: helix-turn-helix transcriptional regulator [Bacteroidota bacterium]
MRTGQTLTHAELVEATSNAMEAEGISAAQVARALGKSRTALSRALAGDTALLATLLDVFAHVTGYAADEQPRTFKLRRLE